MATSRKSVAKVDAKPGGPLALGKQDLAIERFRNMEKDFAIVSRKLCELQSIPENSSFVNGFRTAVESNRIDDDHSKLRLIDKLISKVSELDREVLRKTEESFTVPPRRGSNDNDLYSLPTHLQLVDRLLDYHIQLKRSNEDRISNTNGDNSNMLKYQIEYESLQSRLLVVEDASKQYENMYNKEKQQNDEYKKQAKSSVSSDTLSEKISEIETLRSKVNQLVSLVHNYEEKIESNDSKIQQIVSQIYACNADIKNVPLPTEKCDVLSDIVKRYENQFTCSFSTSSENDTSIDYAESLKKSLSLLLQSVVQYNSVKQGGGSDGGNGGTGGTGGNGYGDKISESNLLKLKQQQLLSLQDEHSSYVSSAEEYKVRKEREVDLLKEQLSRSQEENIQYQKRIVINDKHYANEIEKYKSQLQDIQDQINSKSQERDFGLAQEKLIQSLSDQIGDLSVRNADLVSQQSENKLTLEYLTNELALMNDCNEKLKSKLKQALLNAESGHSPRGGGRSYNDTFEEVMQEEMSSMKKAFEVKLQMAKLEREEISRRHQMEIQKLSNSTSATRLSLLPQPSLTSGANSDASGSKSGNGSRTAGTGISMGSSSRR